MNTAITRCGETICRIPAAANLETWLSRAWTDGLQIDQLDDLENLVVQTVNSTYEITVICGRTGEILVRGGQFFPEKTPAQLSGASFGGSFLKLRGVYAGLKMEFLHQGRRIVTSPVRSIGVTV
jgi:hypothetical protein